MPNNKKQEKLEPEESEVEKRVREMLDITVPDAPEEPTVPETNDQPPPTATPKLTIKVVDHTDSEATPDATISALDAAIADTNQQLAAQTVTAPLLPEKLTKKSVKTAVNDTDDQAPEAPPEGSLTETEDEPEPTYSETETSEESPKTVQDAIDESDKVVGEADSPLESELESPATEQAVSDIIAQESDALLAIQDLQTGPVVPQKKRKRRHFFSAWAHSSAARWATFLIIFGAIVAAGVLPESRYYILNKAGVRSTASVVITDASTLRPLKNVTVTLAGQSVKTDIEGKAQLSQLTLGPSELVVTKRAFAEERKSVTIGWGSNPLLDITLSPKGNQYTFVVTDVFSGKAVANAEATVEDQSAVASEDGVIKLTLDKTEADSVDVTLKAGGYRNETRKLDLNSKADTPVTLTPSGKIAFVSKRSGTYDIYTIEADAKNEKLVLAGTGKETEDLLFTQHPINNDRAILVSSRDGKKSSDGLVSNSLLSINLSDGTTKSITESNQIRLVGWIGTRMIYSQLTPLASAEDPQRYKLMSYDYVSGDNRQLATANYFNDIITVGSRVYFAPASAYQNGVNLGVFVVNADGSGKQAIFSQESWNIYRSAYDHFGLAVQQDWYDYLIGADKPEKLSGQPGSTISRVYSDSPDGKQSIWIDSRDGKGTLVVYGITTKTESILYAISGIKGPIRWINNTTIVYRLSSSAETADYVLSTLGGEPKKLANVTDAAGIDY